MSRLLVTMVLVVGCIVMAGCGQDRGTPRANDAAEPAATHPSSGSPAADTGRMYATIAKQQGWAAEFERGKQMVRELAELSPDKRAKYDITALRGQTVALVAGVAPPGGTNDLVTERGFYLRIVNPQNKDLRPHSVWWEVMVRGKILQVLPENKIIVLEVEADGWSVLQTG